MNIANFSMLNRFQNDVPFIEDGYVRMMLCFLLGENDKMGEHPYFKEQREMLKPQSEMKDGLAHVPIEGVLAYRPDVMEMKYFGVEDSRNVLKMVNDAASSKDAKGIQLNMDTPGGMTVGGFEIAEAVDRASKIKPVVAHIGGMGASLGYLIASQANHVVANGSAIVGSIGAYGTVVDRSRMFENIGIKVHVIKNKEAKFKAAGEFGTALTDDQKEEMTARMQSHFDLFSSMVKTKRPDVTDDCMRGQVFTGRQAKKCGLVDSIGDVDFATSVLKSKVRG